MSVLTGCVHMVDPLTDDLPDAALVTTGSVEGVRRASAAPTISGRGFERSVVGTQDGTVTHWPLRMEDPFVDKGSEDGRFAWTVEDALYLGCGLGRFLVNWAALPISLAWPLPGTLMGSDGIVSRQALGYDHDATPLPGGPSPPIDIVDVDTYGGSAEDDSASPPPDAPPRDPAAEPAPSDAGAESLADEPL